jgi:hypothetical protein
MNANLLKSIEIRLYSTLPHDLRRMVFSLREKKRFRRYQRLRRIVTPEGYSFKPFDVHQCIFVHIPKAAGVSVCGTLLGNLGGGHTTIEEYQMVFPKRKFNRYFKFTFVRNPWDRVFSAYNFLAKGGMDEADRRWAAANLSDCIGFNEFVVERLRSAAVQDCVHFWPQSAFIRCPFRQKPLLDYIGYFENIEHDFEYVKNRLGMGAEVQLSHKNKTLSNCQGNYQTHYSIEAREIVANVYKTDVELLGYNFSNSSLSTQLMSRLN